MKWLRAPAGRPRFSEEPLAFGGKVALSSVQAVRCQALSTPNYQNWVDEQMAKPEFRMEYVRELVRMHRESIEQHDPALARWCMRERARVDSSGSTR